MSSLFGGAHSRASEPNIPVPEAAIRLTTSVQGKARPIGWGRNRIGLNMIWMGGFQPYLVASWSPPVATSAGGKGSRGSSSQGTITYAWNYLVDACFSIAEGPIIGIVAINSNNTWTTSPIAGGSGGLPSGNSITAADLLQDRANLPAITDLTQLGLFGGPLTYATLYRGTQTQNPDPTITAQFPLQALAYRGEAYIAMVPLLLGSSNSIPQMSLDVVFGHLCGLTQYPDEAYPGDVIYDYFTNAEYGVPGYTTDLLETPTDYNLFCGANSLLVSPVITDQVEASSFVNDLLQATHAAIFMSGGKLRIRPYAEADSEGNGLTYVHNATPIYDLVPEDFLPGASGIDPVEINRKQPQDTSTSLRIEYLRRSAGYAPTVIETRDEATIAAFALERQSDVRTQHFFTMPDPASISAALQLQREQVTTTYTFNLPREFELLDPMDLLTLPLDELGMGQARQAIRITEIVENDDYSFTITAEEYLGTADLPIYDRQKTVHNFPEFNTPAGDVNPPLIFELPTIISNGLNVFAALSGGADWGGCEIWASFDGVKYNFIERMLGATRMGYTTNSINAVGGQGYIDFTQPLGVDFTESRGALENATADDMLAATTGVMTASGEILSYTLANLGSAPYKYDLQPLMRGCWGTPVLSHPSGELCCRVDGSITAIPYDETKTGRLIYLKFLSFNKYGGGGQGLGEVDPYTYRIRGIALEPIDDFPTALDGAAVQDFVDAVNSNNEASSVAALVGETSATVTAVSTTVATATQAIATLTTTITAKFSGYDAANTQTAAKIQTIDTAIANGTGALASLTSTVNAKFNSYDAFVTSTTTALAGGAGTTASLQTTVAAQGVTLGTLGTTVSNLGTTVDNLGVSVTTNTTAINNINGTMSARYSLELNVSGRITGFYLFADQSGRSDFAVQADKFQIWATGYANKPVFQVGTIGGVADIIIDGRDFGDLSILTDAVGNNQITNSAASSGNGDSGDCNLTVRTGSRILLIAYYAGGGISVFGGLTLTISYNGTTVTTSSVPSAQGGSIFAYYGTAALYVTTAGSSGTQTARAQTNSISGNVTIYMQEMKK